MRTNTAKHTPGPWIYGTVTGTPGFQFFIDGDSSLVADVAARPEAESNARLIAAAPELADALESLRSAIWDLVDQQAMPDESWKTADDCALDVLRKAGRLP